MKTNKDHIQQGDIVIRRVCSVPENCKPIHDKRGAVLGEGEITGHYHAIRNDSGKYAGNARGVELLEAPDRKRYLVISGEKTHRAVLTHQEHNPIEIPPGTYEIGQVREHDYFTEMTRTVRD